MFYYISKKTDSSTIIIQDATITKAVGNLDKKNIELNDGFILHHLNKGFFVGKIINVDTPINLINDLFTNKIKLTINNPYI